MGIKMYVENAEIISSVENAKIITVTEIEKVPQPDWSQNDETAPDYIKNKVGGYLVDCDIEVFPTKVCSGMTIADLYFRIPLNTEYSELWSDYTTNIAPKLIAGAVYDVVWGGKHYEATCHMVSSGYAVIGALIPELTTPDCPFFIAGRGDVFGLLTPEITSAGIEFGVKLIKKPVVISSEYIEGNSLTLVAADGKKYAVTVDTDGKLQVAEI